MITTSATELLKTLIELESITGNEAKLGAFLKEYLTQLGLSVTTFPAENDRVSIMATTGTPKVLLQAHMDVVPPYVPLREDDTYIYGRGACDTKGSMACMLVAAQQALEQKRTNFGVAFTVGEELDFIGAKMLQTTVQDSGAFLVVGEPTQLSVVNAHYGILTFEIVATGKAAHSSEPLLGQNAIDQLVQVLSQQLPQLKIAPQTLMSVVLISGGVADNIIPPIAKATLSFRIAPNDTTPYAEQLQALIQDPAVRIENVQQLPAVSTKIPPQLSFLGAGQTVKYCTELTFFGNGIVLGPGDIADAHTATEKVKKTELERAVQLYSQILQVMG